MKRTLCFLLLLLCSVVLTTGQQPPASDPTQAIAQYRKRIDALDKQVITLLNERAQIAQEIGRLRQRANIPPASAKSREEEVLRNAMAHSQAPLSPEAARRIYERIIAEMVAIQTADSTKAK